MPTVGVEVDFVANDQMRFDPSGKTGSCPHARTHSAVHAERNQTWLAETSRRLPAASVALESAVRAARRQPNLKKLIRTRIVMLCRRACGLPLLMGMPDAVGGHKHLATAAPCRACSEPPRRPRALELSHLGGAMTQDVPD